jgi:hypothetical protein
MVDGVVELFDGDEAGLFLDDPYRLVKGTGAERFRAALDMVRTRQLDVVGRARADMVSRGIDLDGLLREFTQACLIPGVRAELVDAPKMGRLYGFGFLVASPAIRFTTEAFGTRQLALGIDPSVLHVSFVVMDATMDEDGRWSPAAPATVHNLDAFFERLAFVAGDIQARTISADVCRMEAWEAAQAYETIF